MGKLWPACRQLSDILPLDRTRDLDSRLSLCPSGEVLSGWMPVVGWLVQPGGENKGEERKGREEEGKEKG